MTEIEACCIWLLVSLGLFLIEKIAAALALPMVASLYSKAT
jgi:hypothetical protein